MAYSINGQTMTYSQAVNFLAGKAANALHYTFEQAEELIRDYLYSIRPGTMVVYQYITISCCRTERRR